MDAKAVIYTIPKNVVASTSACLRYQPTNSKTCRALNDHGLLRKAEWLWFSDWTVADVEMLVSFRL